MRSDHSLARLQDQRAKRTKVGTEERSGSEESPRIGKGVVTLALQEGTTILAHRIKTDY